MFDWHTDHGCDQCSASALVRVAKDGQDLQFCSHHYSDHELTLTAAGWDVVSDDRKSLLVTPAMVNDME